MPTFESEIMREARTLARLQRAAIQLRARLRVTERSIRESKRVLRKLVAAGTSASSIANPDWHEVGAPSKLFGVRVGGQK